ncbi:hypothetical protein WMF39_48210 [Sorangium sp. So ce1504]
MEADSRMTLAALGDHQGDEVGEPAGQVGGITLKPSAASFNSHSSVRSAIVSGVPTSCLCPRAPAIRR